MTDATWAASTAEAVADAFESLLWWEDGRIFAAFDLVDNRPIHGIGAMGLIAASSATLAARGLSEQVADHHLRPGAPMWGPKGFAAGSVDPSGGVRSFVQWDGNAVWGATAYWAHLLAVRVERVEIAAQLRGELEALVGANGFREFYDAYSGEPGGAGAASGFTWPALVLEMAANEQRPEGQP
jgi:hypothetical protein